MTRAELAPDRVAMSEFRVSHRPRSPFTATAASSMWARRSSESLLRGKLLRPFFLEQTFRNDTTRRDEASGPLPREVEEGERDDRRIDLLSRTLHRPFDLEPRAGLGEARLNHAERDHLLQDRRPGGAGCLPDLPASTEGGHRAGRGSEPEHRRQPVPLERCFDVRPIEL